MKQEEDQAFYYLDGNCCSMQCMYDWFNVYGQRALDHFGRLTQPRVLTADNAWRKRYDWHGRIMVMVDINTMSIII